MSSYFKRSNNAVIGYVSWGAIFAGVVAALGVASLLNLLGVGLELVGFSTDSQTLKNLSIATIFWLAFNSIVSMFVGGWVAGLLAGKLENRVENLLHGFLMWSITMMLTFWLATTAVGYSLGGVVNITQRALTAASQGNLQWAALVEPQVGNLLKVVAPQDNQLISRINTQAQSIFDKAQKTIQQKPSQMMNQSNEQFSQAIQNFFKAVGTTNQDKAREVVINILVDRGGMSETRADYLVTKWLERYQALNAGTKAKDVQAQQVALNLTEKTSGVLAKIALLALLTLLLGAIAACVGAVMGVKTD